jgi:ATP-dependent DNA helicase RecG
VFFGRNAGWARKQLPLNETLGGGPSRPVRASLQIVHPDHGSEDGGALMGHLVEPVYPCPKG